MEVDSSFEITERQEELKSDASDENKNISVSFRGNEDNGQHYSLTRLLTFSWKKNKNDDDEEDEDRGEKARKTSELVARPCIKSPCNETVTDSEKEKDERDADNQSLQETTGQVADDPDAGVSTVTSDCQSPSNTDDKVERQITGPQSKQPTDPTSQKEGILPPIKITRFSIDDILCPSFGNHGNQKKKQRVEITDHPPVAAIRLSAFTRVHTVSQISSVNAAATIHFQKHHSKFAEGYPQRPTSVSDVQDELEPGHRQVQGHRQGQEATQTGATSPGTNPRVPKLWPAWVYCTRYSDRPSSGPRSRKISQREKQPEAKRPRTAFTSEQLISLKTEFDSCRYLTEERRQNLARKLSLSEAQIKIWFQNKRAKVKKSTGNSKTPLAINLMAQGLYNHSTVTIKEEVTSPVQ